MMQGSGLWWSALARGSRRRALAVSMVALGAGCARSPASLADHFNELASASESQPDRVVRTVAIQPGDTVADLGAGGGVFTIKLAQAVGPAGQVYAVDIESRSARVGLSSGQSDHPRAALPVHESRRRMRATMGS